MKRALCVTSVGIVLWVAASLAAGTARAAPPGTVAAAQSCDRQRVTLTLTVTGDEPYMNFAIGIRSAVPPYDGIAAAQLVASDADAVGTATFSGLPGAASVLIAITGIAPGAIYLYPGHALTLMICSPQAQLNALVTQVQGLNASAGITNSLDAKLSHIQDALNAAKNNSLGVACNSLNAFLNEVAAQAQSQTITAAEAAALRNAALSIRKALGC